ncbi:g-patch domain protein [Dictyocaulus viviparus]|uniref:G-patch domain protein n=1 Tax=Dictyocaulus viviparus TaxID=29172 RepID=A0A0D8Y5J7_DICVI|nr:g-patch domain protein [Dictyocaulus viviparus]
MYSGYEQQHKNYVQHIMQQIAQIDMQIEAEKDRARGAIPSLLSGMSREPSAIQCSGPSTAPGINARRSRFDQQPNAIASKSQESYGQFFAPPSRSAPKQGWMEDEGIPDGDDIDGHPFNEEDLIPSAKYYELPAGIMLPVIEIEQFSYTALVPDKLRMPPPVPPSQRLLSALDEFYSASLDPAREPPLTAWGRGGCSEFMERKQRLKKILEEKLKSENKTVSDLIDNKPSDEEQKIQQDDFNAEIKQKYEEMRRNAVNEEKEKKKQLSPPSPSKRKDQCRGRRSRSTSSSSSSSHSSKSSSSSSTDSSSSWNRSRSRSYSPRRQSRSQSRSLSPGGRPSFGSQHRSPSPVSFGDTSRFRVPEMPLSSGNKGAQLMQKMGWSGTGLGASKQATTLTFVYIFDVEGIIEPIGGGDVRDRQDQFRGLGSTMDPYEQYRKQRSGSYHDRNQANFVLKEKGPLERRQQYVGCPYEVHFDTWGRSDRLLLSTRENVFAAISANTGEIMMVEKMYGQVEHYSDYLFSMYKFKVGVWRRIQENAKSITLSSVVDNKALYTISDAGRAVRAWNKLNGALLWQKSIAKESNQGFSPRIVVSEQTLVTLSSENLSAFSTNGEELWTSHVPNRCAVLHNFFVCGKENLLVLVDIVSPTLKQQQMTVEFIVKSLLILDGDLLLVKGGQSAVIFTAASGGLHKKLSIAHQIDSASLSSNALIIVNGKDVEVYDATTFKILLKNAFELLTIGADCRMEYFVVDVTKSSVISEWVREEALARISAVEMVDLPLSELQQMIEDEFEERDAIPQMALCALSVAHIAKTWLSLSFLVDC